MDIQSQIEAVDAIMQTALPRLSELEAKREAVRDELSKALVDRALDKKSGDQVDRLRGELYQLDQAIGDEKQIITATRDRQSVLQRQEMSLKLTSFEAELRELAPKVGKLADDYLKARDALRQSAEAYNAAHKRAARLRPLIQEYRQILGAVGEDLPGVRHLRFGDSHTGITLDQLEGRRPW